MPDDLRTRIAKAITADAEKPPHLRVGVIDAMLAVVQPELDRLTVNQFASSPGWLAADRDSWQMLADVANERAQKAEAERDQYAARVPLVCSDERHDAKVRGLEVEVQRFTAELQAAIAANAQAPRENCMRDRQHPAHRWMLGRVLYQCPGVTEESHDA